MKMIWNWLTVLGLREIEMQEQIRLKQIEEQLRFSEIEKEEMQDKRRIE